MSETVISTNVIKLKAQSEHNGEKHNFIVTLKNPLPISESDTMIANIGVLNQSLAGGLNNKWFADLQAAAEFDELYPVKKIIKAEIFEQTKTTSEDGKTITTVSRQNNFYEDNG